MPAGKQKAKEKVDVEDDGVMRKEVRKKERAFDFLKVVLKYAFSQIGVVVLCVGYAVVGANIYLSMELPLEEERRKAKEEVAIEIIKMEEFLSGAFWEKIHHQYPEKRLNETAFMEKVSRGNDTYIMRRALTERHKNSAILYMQRLLNKVETEKRKICKQIDQFVPVNSRSCNVCLSLRQ